MKRIKRKNSGESESLLYYSMLLPFSLLFFLFTVLPVASSIVLSFTDFDMVSVPKFNGVANYARMLLNDRIFPITVKNTLFFAVVTGPLGFLL